MTFDEWYEDTGFKLMGSGLSVKEVLYTTYVSGYMFGFDDGTMAGRTEGYEKGISEAKDRDYEI